MKTTRTGCSLAKLLGLTILLARVLPQPLAGAAPPPRLAFCCQEDNDLYRVVQTNGAKWPRFDTPAQAVAAAAEDGAVLILAAGYPAQPTPLEPNLFAQAAGKNLRLYVEFPSFLPGLEVGRPRTAEWERAVVASAAFGPSLAKGRLLSLHHCSYVEAGVHPSHLVLARVAGYDTAVFGLPKRTAPLLFELPAGPGRGAVLVSATQLSRFVTSRYAPTDVWEPVWRMVFRWLAPELDQLSFRFTPTVRPLFSRTQPLPPDVEVQAWHRGVQWFEQSRLLLASARLAEAQARAEAGWALPPPVGAPTGDGSLGILEGYLSRLEPDGRQIQTIARRGDCTAESAMALAFAGKILPEPRYTQVASNLLEFYLFHSPARKGERADPNHGAFGLVAWGISTPAWRVANYGDDNARLLLGALATAALTKQDRWDEALLQCLLANLRTTGRLGFRGDRLDVAELGARGWEHFFQRPTVSYAPHYESYLWACYLWAWRATGFDLFRDRAKAALRRTMAAYPDRWRWTNGMQQERARMLLPLAWLVRLEDTPEHRAWLRRLAADLLARQDATGALAEEIGALGRGQLLPPQSNEAYGTGEAPLLQQNGDPVCDLLYTCNFAFLGLHEAAAATRDPFYSEAEEKLARFLCRIQVGSEAHPMLHGGWFRAFDFRRWDYWGSSSDNGWGPWCIESGWTQGWITSVLALRQLRTSLWDLTASSAIKRHLEKLRPAMIPDRVLNAAVPPLAKHAALGKPVVLLHPPSPLYPGDGAASLCDGLLAQPDYQDPAWLGFWGEDGVATIDLGEPLAVSSVRLRCLQSVAVGIFLPSQVDFFAGNEPGSLALVASLENKVSPREAGPFIQEFAAKDLNLRARFLRVRARNLGAIPAWHPVAGAKAWLFLDELMVQAGAGK